MLIFETVDFQYKGKSFTAIALVFYLVGMTIKILKHFSYIIIHNSQNLAKIGHNVSYCLVIGAPNLKDINPEGYS